MPNIPVYKPSISAFRPDDSAAWVDERAARSTSEAISGLADVAGKVADKAAGMIEAPDASKQGADLFAGLTADWNAYTKDPKNNPADPQYIQKFNDEHLEPALDKYQDGWLSSKGKAYAQSMTNTIREHFRTQTAADASNIAGDAVVNNLTDARTSLANTVASDPAQLPTALTILQTTMHSALTNPNLTGDAAAKIKGLYKDYAATIADSGLDGLVSKVAATGQSPDAIAAIKAQITADGSPYTANASPAKYAETLSKFDKIANTTAATQTKIADIQWPKIMAAVREGDPTAVAAAQQLADSAVGTEAGETEVLRAKKNSELQDAVEQGNVARKYNDMPQPEIDAQYGTLRSAAVAGDKTAEYAVKSIDARTSEFHKDQAAYMLNTDTVVSSRYSAMFNADGQFAPTPKTFADYLNASSAAQTHLYPGTVPRVLTNEMTAPIQTAMRAITQTGEGAENAAGVLAQTAKMTGSYWPNIGKELMDRHVINGDQFAAAMLASKPSAAALVPVLLSTSAMSAEQRAALHGVPEGKVIGVASKAFDSFNKTLANIPEAAETIGANTTALAHLMQAKGVTSQDDANKLAQSMLLDEYTIKDDTLRISNDSGVDANAIGSGAQKMRSQLGPYQIDVPKSYSGLGAGDQRSNYINQLQQSARFYATPDGKGATLYPAAGASTPVTAAGKPITLTWKQLSDMGR